MGQESKIESAVCKYAQSKGCYVRKFSSPSRAGVPDRLFLTPNGLVFFIEFKAPGKRPTALQQREIDEIENRHGLAKWVDSVEEGKFYVDQLCKVKSLGYEL